MFNQRQSAGKTESLSLAYLLGVYLGDGCISRCKNNSHDFRLNTIDYEFAEATAKALYNLIGKRPKIYKQPIPKNGNSHNYYLRMGCKKLCDFLENETGKKDKIPEWVCKLPDDELKEFICGMMDSDGYVRNYRNNPKWLGMGFRKGASYTFQLASILQKIGCKVRTYIEIPKNKKYKKVYGIRMNAKSFIQSGCYFKIKRKQQRFGILRDYTL